MLNLLLVEDDLDLASTVVDYLGFENIQCDHAANGIAGLNIIRQQQNENQSFDVILLDINMPRMDGLSLCQTLRQEGINTPILMLTARDTLQDKIAGFNAGTDDYLVKPFEIEELLVRILALSKRRSGQMTRLSVGDLQLDTSLKTANINEQRIKLTPTTYQILEALMRATPEPVSRAALLQSIWGDEIPDSSSLRVHIHHLRKALDVVNASDMIKTIAGFGFAIDSLKEQGS
jgi:DNA-binding response OmpR family regulator